MRRVRVQQSLNYIKNADCFPSPSPENGNLRFVVTDFMDVLKRDLLPLRDNDGNPAIKVLDDKVDGHPVVEVLIPPAELMSACACCGKWESIGAPRFMRCSKCRSRQYCSQDCQKRDWKSKVPKGLSHKEECKLLEDGKEYEVESIVKLHNNHWSNFGGSDRMVDEDDFTSDYAVYGQRTPPSPNNNTNPFGGPGLFNY